MELLTREKSIEEWVLRGQCYDIANMCSPDSSAQKFTGTQSTTSSRHHQENLPYDPVISTRRNRQPTQSTF